LTQHDVELENELHARKKLLTLIKNKTKMLEEDEDAEEEAKELAKEVKRLYILDNIILDRWYLKAYGMKKGLSKDTVVWLLFANGLLLFGIACFMTMMFYSIQTLESKVFPTGRLFEQEIGNAK